MRLALALAHLLALCSAQINIQFQIVGKNVTLQADSLEQSFSSQGLAAPTQYSSNSQDSLAVQACSPGSFITASGCAPCQPGTFSATGATACLPCAQGTFSAAQAAYCTPCAPSTFSDAKAAPACQLCPPYTNSSQGAAYCSCNRGLWKIPKQSFTSWGSQFALDTVQCL